MYTRRVPESHMERFWDARAREDPFWFVDSRLRYGAPDEEAFWAEGERSLECLLDGLGVHPRADQIVVDIGCGLGRLTRPLAERTAHVYAIDVSGEMLSEARRLNPQLQNVEWIHGDGATLRPIPDGAADLCISHVVFRHIPDPQITLGYVREMGRVLRAGGLAAFEFSNDPASHRHRKLALRDRVRARLGRAPQGVGDRAWLGSHLELADLRGVAEAAGMEVQRVHGAGTEFCGALLERRAG